MAFAVSAMNTVSSPHGSFFISRSVSIPSIPGIMWSMKMTSYRRPAAILSASAPEDAVSTAICVFFSRPRTTVRFTGTSSTTSTRASGAWKASLRAAAGASSVRKRPLNSPMGHHLTTGCSMAKENSDPSP